MILHCDLDTFYVSVERHKNPELRNRPVVIAGDRRGVVLCASYEARQFGIKAGMPSTKARSNARNCVFLKPDFRSYMQYSKRFYDVLYSVTPDVEIFSVDEAFLDMRNSILYWKSFENMAHHIKDAINSGMGLPVSIGIAGSKVLAKTVTSFAKPDGIFIVSENNQRDFLMELPVSKLFGIGDSLAERLKQAGVYFVLDILKYDRTFWQKYLGKTGLWLYEIGNNRIPEEIEKQERRSIGNSVTFDNDLLYGDVLPHIRTISENVGRTLRDKGFVGKTVTLKVRYDNFSTFTSSVSSSYTALSGDICRNALKLFEKYENYHGRFRLVGITVSNLKRENEMMPGLFEGQHRKKERIYEIVDHLNSKHKNKTHYLG